MEACRQRRSGEKKKVVEQNEKRTDLTPTGLLREGDNAPTPAVSLSVIAILR